MVDIFDEVSSDLRAEQATRLLRRYGLLLIAVMLLVLLAVAGSEFLAWFHGRQNNQAAAAYLRITVPLDNAGAGLGNEQRLDAAKQLQDFSDHAPAGYRSLARLRAAGLDADAGQLAAAEGLWDQVAGDGGADPLLRGLANLLWAQHALGSAPDAQVAAKLAPLAETSSPWHALAQESQALLYLRQGNTSQAKALFSQISADPGAPEGVRNRADGLLAKLNG